MKIRGSLSIYFAFITVFSVAVVTSSFIVYYNLDWYDVLIANKIFLVPVGIFFFVLIGLFAFSLSWMLINVKLKSRKKIIEQLEMLESGNYRMLDLDTFSKDEYYIIFLRLNEITSKMKNQTITYQKLVNERVEWTKDKREEVLKEERNRLARELHDSVSQQLFAATMLLSALTHQNQHQTEAEKKQMNLLENIINEAQSEMRALLLHLRPVQLEGKSLKIGIEEMLAELTEKLSIQVLWNIQDVTLEKGVEDQLFRIIQEAVSNSLRHAKASVVEVNLKKINKMIYLKISDDGKGFEMNEKKTGSYGLTNMRERSEAIGATFKLVSVLNQGTSIEVKVPYV